MEIHTTGTSGVPAERFFLRLKQAGITSIIDTRAHPSSQLAGYAKSESLKFFAKELLGVTYIHEPILCPTSTDLKNYRDGIIDWETYSHLYKELLASRKAHESIDFSQWGEKPALLCSEESPENCHRRLASQFLKNFLPNVTSVVDL